MCLLAMMQLLAILPSFCCFCCFHRYASVLLLLSRSATATVLPLLLPLLLMVNAVAAIRKVAS